MPKMTSQLIYFLIKLTYGTSNFPIIFSSELESSWSILDCKSFGQIIFVWLILKKIPIPPPKHTVLGGVGIFFKINHKKIIWSKILQSKILQELSNSVQNKNWEIRSPICEFYQKLNQLRRHFEHFWTF